MMERKHYPIKLTVNKRSITELVIDPHYRLKHGDSIDDKTVIELVDLLDNQVVAPDDIKGNYSYFVMDKLELHGKLYRLVWLLEENQSYIGVINAFRR